MKTETTISKADGKTLFRLGCPQNKIKFLIGKEYSSEEELVQLIKEPFQKKKEQPLIEKDGEIFNWLLETFEHLPMSFHGDVPRKMSKSELRRTMNSDSFVLNGIPRKAKENFKENDFPVTSMIWFPSGDKKTSFC